MTIDNLSIILASGDVTSAIITGCFTLAAAVLGFGVRIYIERLQFTRVPKDRIQALEGFWKGRMHQVIPGSEDELEFDVDFCFAKGVGRAITGTLQVSEPHEKMSLKLTGGFVDKHFIRFDYADESPGVIRYGQLFCHVDAESKTFNGRFVGYSARAGGITHGHGQATKQ